MHSASMQLGRSQNWLAATVYNGADCQCGTVAELAELCGYRLCVVPADAVPDNAVVIDKGE